ncbi:hypothetical protein SEPCBS57363_006839, partial [Sporothrix epigloea]
MLGFVYGSPGTTLQVLAAKIRSFISSWDIDRLRCHWLPPWTDPPDAKIIIENGTKEEVAASHRRLVAELELSDVNVVYTDGSKQDSRSSRAFCHKIAGVTVAKSAEALGSSVEIADCECLA